MKYFNKFMYLFLTLMLFLVSASGCGLNEKEVKNPNLDDIVKNIESEIPLDFVSKSDNTKSLKRFFSLNSSDYEQVILFSPASSMNVEEILIIKLKSPDQVDLIESAIENRVDKQLQSFSGYAPEQCALLEDYIFKVSGNYIFYSVGEKSEEIKQIFVNSI